MTKALRLFQRKLKQPYHLWLFGGFHRLLLFFGIPIVGSIALKLSESDRFLKMIRTGAIALTKDTSDAIPLFVQAVVLLIFAIWHPRLSGFAKTKLPHDETVRRRVEDAIRQFARLWRIMWFSAALYYVVWAVTVASGENWNSKTQPPLLLYVTSTAMMSLTNFLLLVVYFVLSEKTVGDEAKGFGDVLITWAGLFFAYILVDFVVARYFPDTLKLRRAILGVISGLIVAMFVGRLDSKVLSPPYWVIAFLYIYALIQPAYSEFTEPMVVLVMPFIALLCKVVLFTYVLSVFWYGQIVQFALALRPLIDERNKNEQEIKGYELRREKCKECDCEHYFDSNGDGLCDNSSSISRTGRCGHPRDHHIQEAMPI